MSSMYGLLTGPVPWSNAANSPLYCSYTLPSRLALLRILALTRLPRKCDDDGDVEQGLTKGDDYMKGTVKRLVSDKGFGFIAAEDGNEYFFHQSACSGMSFQDLREGQNVTFDAGQGPKGPRGENVRLA
jgi:CspA family cold shock protein